MTTPTIPHGYRLVSGPHTAAEVEEGWTITGHWTAPVRWSTRRECAHDSGFLFAAPHGRMVIMRHTNDPERDIYRIEKVSP